MIKLNKLIEDIHQEDWKLSEELQPNEQVVATNRASWHWEYDGEIRNAYLIFNRTSHTLRVVISTTQTKSGLGAGSWTVLLAKTDIGTLEKPQISVATSLLAKHNVTKGNFNTSFGKKWVNKTDDDREMPLGEVIEGLREDNISGYVRKEKVIVPKKKITFEEYLKNIGGKLLFSIPYKDRPNISDSQAKKIQRLLLEKRNVFAVSFSKTDYRKIFILPKKINKFPFEFWIAYRITNIYDEAGVWKFKGLRVDKKLEESVTEEIPNYMGKKVTIKKYNGTSFIGEVFHQKGKTIFVTFTDTEFDSDKNMSVKFNIDTGNILSLYPYKTVAYKLDKTSLNEIGTTDDIDCLDDAVGCADSGKGGVDLSGGD